MASKKDAKKKAQSTVPYVLRALDDQYVQEQLRQAATRLSAVYERASNQGGEAAEDKRLYDNLREGLTSIRRATAALQRPKPEPKKHRGRRILAAALGVESAALLILKRPNQRSHSPRDPSTISVRDDGSQTGNGAFQRTAEPERVEPDRRVRTAST